MPIYVRFPVSDGSTILVEVEPQGSDPETVVKQTALDESLQSIVKVHAKALCGSIEGLTTPPSEVEIAFSVKIVGESGDLAICQTGAEANYAVKLTWKHSKPADTAHP